MSDCPELDGDTLPLWGSLDAQTAATTDLIDADPSHTYDRELIDRAVERVAMKHGGTVSTNAVRRELTADDGRLRVLPQAIGPRLKALTRDGVLEVVGYDVNDDTSGNAGKPQRLRRWVA